MTNKVPSISSESLPFRSRLILTCSHENYLFSIHMYIFAPQTNFIFALSFLGIVRTTDSFTQRGNVGAVKRTSLHRGQTGTRFLISSFQQKETSSLTFTITKLRTTMILNTCKLLMLTYIWSSTHLFSSWLSELIWKLFILKTITNDYIVPPPPPPCIYIYIYMLIFDSSVGVWST